MLFRSDHTANKIFESGVSMSLNTDGRTITDVTLTHEYELMKRTFKWGISHLRQCNLEAIRHSFASENVKRKIISLLEEKYGN